jgi:transcriptional regulator with XRE-family HTH domain
LAEGAGLSESAIRDYEQGKRMPSLEAALRLAIALGKSLSVWDNLSGITTGAYRLHPSQPRAGALEFGQYKGRLPTEVPTDYLAWLEREKPSKLSAVQLETVRRILRERRRDQRAGEAQAQATAAERRQRDRDAREALRRAEIEARRAEAEAMRVQAEAQRALAQAQAEESRRERRVAELRPAPKPQPDSRPALDDLLPGESAETQDD